MKARLSSPAVTRARAVPWKATGGLAREIFSRIPVKMIKANANPTAAPNPKAQLFKNESYLLIFNTATPNTAQLVVINGR